ncbi:MAG TPA: lysophospholipid acyltransferase family protein [Bryobacteraceae bacterium]
MTRAVDFLRTWLFFVPLMAVSTILCGSVSLLLSLFGFTQRRQIAIGRIWARSLLKLAGVKVSVEGRDRIPPDARCVFVSNHLSYMDTPVVFSYLPEFRFLAKKGLFQIPFLGWHLKTAGHVPVPREDPRASLRTLSRAADMIQEKGTSLLIFSEGGRTVDGKLADFKEGAAYLAIKAQAPLVPIALVGTRDILPMGSSVVHPGCVTLRFGHPIPTTGLTLRDRQRLTEGSREQIAAMLAGIPEPAG